LPARLWPVVYVGVGLADLLLLTGVLRALASRRLFRVLAFVLTIRFLLVTGMALGRDFAFVLVDLVATLLLLLGLALHLTFVRPRPFGPALLVGVALSLAGAYVEARQIVLASGFNQHDLFHVLQMLAVAACHRAARAFPRPLAGQEA
jgi:hypothetical protein